MIEEQAVITKQDGDLVTLEIERQTACSLCGQTRGCGNATWGKLLGHDQHRVEVKNTLGAKVGDLVMVGLEEKIVLNAAMFLYVLPLAAMLIGALIAHWTWHADLAVMMGSVAGLVIGFLITKRCYQPQHGRTSKTYAKLLRFAGAAESN